MSDLDMFLLGLMTKWTMVLAIFWIVYWSLPRTSLKPRVWIWRAALLVAIGVTVVSLLQPLAQLPLLAAIEPPTIDISPARSPSTAASAPTTTATDTLAAHDTPSQPSRFADMPLNITPVDSTLLTAQRPSRDWSPVFISMWIFVSAWLLARLLTTILRDWHLLQVGKPIHGPAREQFEQLLNELSPTQRHGVQLHWSSAIDTPVATGLVRPRILLPESLRNADATTLRSALAHELAHITSRDIAWSLALRLWQALAWVCPLVWLVPRQHHEACELLADHQASCSLANRAHYRQILATLALNLLAPSAKRVPRGAAISMLRTPMILHRLSMLESTGANAHLNLITRFVFSLICIVGLSLGGIGVARSRAQETPVTKPQLVETRPVIVSEDANNNADDSIRVLAPDGSPAKDVRVAVAPNSYEATVLLSADAQLFPLAGPVTMSYPGLASVRKVLKPIVLDGNSVIKKSTLGKGEYLVAWNDQGFHHIVFSRLVGLKELKLQSWSGLDLQVRNGQQPLAKCDIEVTCRCTSDGVHQGTAVETTGTTDEQGRLVLSRVPPGALVISHKTFIKTFQNTTTTISPRSITVLAHPGEVVEVKQGGDGQRVEGKLQLSGYSPNAFTGELLVNDRREVFNFQIEDDGSFGIDDVPAGKHELSFRLMNPYKFYASYSFQFPGNAADPPFSVGTIEPKQDRSENTANQPVGEVIKRNWIPTKLSLAPTSEPIRWIDSLANHYVLRSHDGKILLDLTDMPVPPGWSSGSALFDLDLHHHRLTLLMRDADNQYLCVMSDRGEPLWTRFLNPLGSHRVAFDSRTGNIWLLSNSSLDDSKVEVLDSEGRLLQSHNDNAFTLSYCESDNTFWFGGQREIKKVDAKDGRVLASFDMPEGIFTVDQLRSGSDGSVLACEGAHPNISKSANRLWHIDAQGKLIAATDIGSLAIKGVAPQAFGQDYIASATQRLGWLGAWERKELLIRISSDLKTVRKITKLEDEVVNTDKPGVAWLRTEDKRLLVNWDKTGKVRTVSFNP